MVSYSNEINFPTGAIFLYNISTGAMRLPGAGKPGSTGPSHYFDKN